MPQSGGQPSRKDTGTVGRGDLPSSGDGTSGGGHDATSSGIPSRAGVVIHATIEHVGLVGDTELTVNVKWPASTFCVQAGKKTAASTSQTSDSQFVPENGPDAMIFGEAAADPMPYDGSTPAAEPAESKSETQTWPETERKPESSS